MPEDDANTDRFTPPQAHVTAAGLLSSGFSCVLQMPTGSGKTWLAERAVADVLASGRRAIFVTPLRALAAELASRWQRELAAHKVGVFTGDYGVAGRPYPVPFAEAELLVMTPERLDACLRAWRSHWSWLPLIDLVVVDELHLLGDPRRGPRLEGAILRLRRLNPFARVLGLSATLGNREELAAWLDGVEYGSTWRPIPLRWRVARYRKADAKPDLLLEEVQRVVRCGGKSLVFVQSRRRAETLARHLADHELRAAHHHAGLDHTCRSTVEQAFRSGTVDVLVATATLEMGLNLPVRQVVLYDLQVFDGTDFRPLSTSSVWQRAGRAGRPGLDPEGEVVLLAPAWDRSTDAYEAGRFEPIRSGLDMPAALSEQVVAEVASGLSRTPSQLRDTFAISLAARQARLPALDRVVASMCEAGMLTDRPLSDTDRGAPLRATRLGHIATRHLLSPATVLLFKKVLEANPTATLLDVLVLVTCADDCEPVLPVDFEELAALAEALRAEPAQLLATGNEVLLMTLGVSPRRLLAAFKMALVVRAWTRTGEVESVAERFGCYPFELRRLVESCGRLLLPMAAVLDDPAQRQPDVDAPQTAIDPEADEEPALLDRVRALGRMVAAGLCERTVTLTLVRGLGPKLARRLRAAGVEDIEDLALADEGELAQIRGLSAKRAALWIAEAESLVKSRSAFWLRELTPPLAVRQVTWPDGVDPYRLRRALELKVVTREKATYTVSGGLEPHTVSRREDTLACDCGDAAGGHLCKHQLAVRMHRGDRQLRQLAKDLATQQHDHEGVDLFDLWFSGRSPTTRRRT